MYRVRHGGALVECDSAEEAKALMELIGWKRGSSDRPKQLPSSAHQSASRAKPKNGLAKLAVPFLRAVVEAGKTGVTGGDLMRQFGLKGPRAVGSVLGGLREKLHGIKVEENQVLTKRRVGDSRFWVPGGKAREALELLEKQ